MLFSYVFVQVCDPVVSLRSANFSAEPLDFDKLLHFICSDIKEQMANGRMFSEWHVVLYPSLRESGHICEPSYFSGGRKLDRNYLFLDVTA